MRRTKENTINRRVKNTSKMTADIKAGQTLRKETGTKKMTVKGKRKRR